MMVSVTFLPLALILAKHVFRKKEKREREIEHKRLGARNEDVLVLHFAFHSVPCFNQELGKGRRKSEMKERALRGVLLDNLQACERLPPGVVAWA
mmetsp:Transcript_10625/g.20604  ORF Transcript_10625/g.20604 Transcript_10625/m.20604 type:complete len:95 (-) Transcript_10625:353-637(-)